eukprot:8287524-Pyramimonas_sp.AAC.1
MIATRLARGRELPSPRRVGSGCWSSTDVGNAIGQWCVIVVPSRLALDLDVLDDRDVAQARRHPSHNMVSFGAMLRRLN